MPDVGSGIKKVLVQAYLSGTADLVHRRLGGRQNRRDFSRVVIAGALGRKNGITRGACLQARALRAQGVATELVDVTGALRNPFLRVPHGAGTTYIIHNDAPQTASLLGSLMPNCSAAYRIAYWAWELPDPPPGWAGFDRNVDEVWTPSRFAQSSLSSLIRCPIHVVPHHVSPKPPRQRAPDQPFTVLAMADSRSSLTRKNPDGAVEAFRRAFGTSSSAHLLLKMSGRPGDIDSFEKRIATALAGGNVTIIRDYLDDEGLARLYRRADVLLSLHRAEGFGLPMLEAMSHGVPAMATGWSGNLEFMNSQNSILVPFHLVPVQDRAGIYRGSVWAEPDLDAAAEQLRELAVDQALYERFAAASHRSVATAVSRLPLDSMGAAA